MTIAQFSVSTSTASSTVGLLALSRSRELAVWLGLPIALFLGLAVASSLNIGIRHLLPMYPFLFGVAGLGLAYAASKARIAAVAQAAGAEWRSHFHVPIFLKDLEDFSTTQDFLREMLSLHRDSPISQHLEVETYTWDVLPERYRKVGVSAAIARELAWVKDQLAR